LEEIDAGLFDFGQAGMDEPGVDGQRDAQQG